MTETGAIKGPTFRIGSELGTFEGFNFREQAAIERNLTAEEVVNWDHDDAGEAEFWPAGDHAGVAKVFEGRSSVTGSELLALDRLLGKLGGDEVESFLKIHYAVNTRGLALAEVTVDDLDDLFIHIFRGMSFIDLRREAAYQLFEDYYPEAFRMWNETHCDGLRFDPEEFLDSPSWSVEEVRLGDEVALIIVPQ